MSSLHDRVVARLRESPDRWFTSNSLAAELASPSDGAETTGPSPSRETVQSTLESLHRTGVVEQEGSTFRWANGGGFEEGQSADGTSSQ